MVVDAVEGQGVLYVRGAGFQEVWEVSKTSNILTSLKHPLTFSLNHQDVPLQSAPRRSPAELRALQTGSGSLEEALMAYTQET